MAVFADGNNIINMCRIKRHIFKCDLIILIFFKFYINFPEIIGNSFNLYIFRGNTDFIKSRYSEILKINFPNISTDKGQSYCSRCGILDITDNFFFNIIINLIHYLEWRSAGIISLDNIYTHTYKCF